MRIIGQSFELIRMDTAEVVEIAGRTCYKSEEKIGCTIRPEERHTLTEALCRTKEKQEESYRFCPKCPFHSSARFAKMLIKRQHTAMLEHGIASVKLVTNRGVTHEFVRHRMSSYGQESTRYVKYDDMVFIRPVWCSIPDNFELVEPEDFPTWKEYAAKTLGMCSADITFIRSCFNASLSYQYLLKDGWTPEKAREVLPNALKTEIVITTNFREWCHIFNLRAIGTTGKPHPQMKALMGEVLEEFALRVPSIFGEQYKQFKESKLDY